MPDRKKTPGQPNRDDLELWQAVSKSVTPISPQKKSNLSGAKTPPKYDNPPENERQKKPESEPQAPRRKPEQVIQPPELTGLDRRTRQKFSRGNIEIDGTIDLHGMTQAQAHSALNAKFQSARAMGQRNILVITGKGQSRFGAHTLHGQDYVAAPGRTGVLRDAVAQWLNEPALRSLVAGFQPAHPRHGGGGAFYVRLRRKRTGD